MTVIVHVGPGGGGGGGGSLITQGACYIIHEGQRSHNSLSQANNVNDDKVRRCS